MVEAQSDNVPVNNCLEENAVFEEGKGSHLGLESYMVEQLLETVTVALVSEAQFNIVPLKGKFSCMLGKKKKQPTNQPMKKTPNKPKHTVLGRTWAASIHFAPEDKVMH